MDNNVISKEHIEFVSKKSGIDEETVIKVLEADIEYLDIVIEYLDIVIEYLDIVIEEVSNSVE